MSAANPGNRVADRFHPACLVIYRHIGLVPGRGRPVQLAIDLLLLLVLLLLLLLLLTSGTTERTCFLILAARTTTEPTITTATTVSTLRLRSAEIEMKSSRRGLTSLRSGVCKAYGVIVVIYGKPKYCEVELEG